MSNALFTSATEVITPAIAAAYLQHNTDNRPINQARVNFYADQMKKGLWKMNGEAICFDMHGNLGNGQHRLLAIVAAGVPVEMLVCRNVDDDSFKTYDSGMNRKASDVFALCDILNATNVAACVRKFYQMSVGQTAWAFNAGGVGASAIKLSNAELVDLYNKYPADFQEFVNYAKCVTKTYKLYSGSDIAATMAHLHISLGYSKIEIFRFFDMLFDYKHHPEFNDGHEMQATHDLRERIIRMRLSGVAMTGRYKSQLLAKAWNLYIAGKDVKVLKVVDGEEVTFK